MKQPRITVELTQAQLDALVSLAEMTCENAHVTFADWAFANDRAVSAVAGAERALRAAERKATRAQRPACREGGKKEGQCNTEP